MLGVQLLHDKHDVPVSSVFRYLFTHMDSYSCCKKACKRIEQLVYYMGQINRVHKRHNQIVL